MEEKKATFGLAENIANLCCYAGFFVTGIIFLVSEKENRSVRFNALQSTVWFFLTWVLSAVVGKVIGWIPLIGGLITGAFGLVIFASWVMLMFCAYQGKEFRIPILGDIVHDTVNK